MIDNIPKISFIPKSSLIHGESFMERKRPRSIMGVLATFVFMLSVGSYVGLYFYGDTLEEKNKKITADIESAQSVFSQSPDIIKAKEFRDRAEIARSLLSARIAVSPVIDFIERSTVSSILYEKFSFNGEGGELTLELAGEAPTYASLAYQADVLRGKSKELTGFSIDNVVLTKFGTISFTVKAVFTQEYLSYLKTKEVKAEAGDFSTVGAVAPAVISTTSPSTPSVVTTPPLSSPFMEPVSSTTTAIESVLAPEDTSPLWEVSERAPAPVIVPELVPATRSFWSWFKFW